MWGKAGVEFITSNVQKISSEIIPMAVLVADRVEEGSLGMVTTFCHHGQPKVEPSEALSTLLQWESPKPSVVVVKIFANSPNLQWGSFSLPHLDVTTLAEGMLATQFPLACLCLCRLLPFLSTQVVLLHEEDDEELKVYPFFQEVLWESSEEDFCLSDHVLLLVSPSSFSPHQEESSQIEEGPSHSLAPTQLQNITWAKAQLEQGLDHEWEGLARKYEDWQTRMAMKHEDQWARMAEEVDATFQEVFSAMSSTDLVRLRPWCISTATNPGAIPIYYMNETLATTMQWREDVPTATNTPESKDSWAPASTNSPLHQTGTSPLPMSDIPLINTLQVGCSLIGFIINPKDKKWDHSPNSALDDWPGKKTCAKTAEADISNEHSTPQGDGESFKCHWRYPTTAWLPLEVIKNMTVRTTLITVVMSLPRMSQGRKWLIPIQNQPLGIVSLV